MKTLIFFDLFFFNRVKNHLQNTPRTLPKPPKSHAKTMGKREKTQLLNIVRNKCKQIAKKCELGANLAPKMKKCEPLGGTCGPHSIGPSAQTSKKAGFNHAGGGTPAHFLRSARPAEAAIAKVFAKVFAKIRQKILFCKFFGRAGRTGTSRTTSCQNFSLERPLAVPKT